MSYGAASDALPGCYRHPDTPTGVRCQRCHRPICPQCQIPGAVGFLCPDCARQARVTTRRPSKLKTFLRRPGAPVVTYVIIALCVLVWLAQLLFPALTNAWVFAPWPGLVFTEPWRFITAAFLHSTSSPLHILFNMYTLWVFGQVLEPMLGRSKYIALYVLSALGGSVAVYLINFNENVTVLGASGAIFGLLGALVVVLKRRAMEYRQLIVLIVLNFVMGFLWSGVSWQAHLGGLVTGAAVAFLLERHVVKRQPRLVWLVAAAVIVILVALVYGRTFIF